MARSRNKKYIPEGAIIQPDGSWFYRFTEEERKEFMDKYKTPGTMFGPPIGYGELVCNAD
jgi:hypothetical protein